MTYYSQIGQDQYYIEKVIKKSRNGIFLDVGAHDGIFTSNTATLELEYGWTGICIEPNYHLVSKLRVNRKNSKIEHCAVWETEGTAVLEIPKQDFNDIKGHLLSRLTNVKDKSKFVKHFSAETETVQVPTKTITQIVKDTYRLPFTIDYMSLDTEGAELEALKGIDFNNIKINFMTIEHGNRPGFKEVLIEYLIRFGYKLHRINKWDIEFEANTNI